MKARVGERVIIVKPDETSLRQGVQQGHIGKVISQYDVGCFAENPLWARGKVGLLNAEFEVVSKDDEGILDFWDIELEGCT